MTVLLLVFAEVLPKTVAINYPDRMSLIVARGRSPFSSRSSGRSSSRSSASCAASCISSASRRPAALDPLRPGGAEKRGRSDAQGRRRRPLRPRHVRRPARPQGTDRLRRHGPSHQDGRARRRPAASPSSCAKSSPRPLRACRSGATIPTTSSACCTPRICCAPRARRRRARASQRREHRARSPGSCRTRRRSQDQLQAFRKRKTHFALVVDEYGDVRAW